MCLFSTIKEPTKAQKDIVCYKFLMGIGEDKKEILYTPFTDKQVCKHENIINHVQKPKELFCFPKREGISWRIDGGAIHAYKELYDVLTHTNVVFGSWLYRKGRDYKIFKCIIPKGTKYWNGDYDICARKLKYVEELQLKDEEVYAILREKDERWGSNISDNHRGKGLKKKRKRKAKKC